MYLKFCTSIRSYRWKNLRQCFLLSLLLLGLNAFGYGRASQNVYVDKAVSAFPEFSIKDTSVFQLISHGQPGELYLNGSWKDVKAISQFILSNHLLNSDIRQMNIYGCEFAKGRKGSQAVAYK